MSRGWLIDTNIVSEWVKPRPDVGVVRWLDEVDEDRIFLSVISLAEIRFGVERLAPGRRRTRLDAWLREELPARFERRIVRWTGKPPTPAAACWRERAKPAAGSARWTP